MRCAYFRFHGDLTWLLAPGPASVVYPLNGETSVKHPIEALGVPHSEVELILVNEAPVGFGYLLQPGDRVHVYPPADFLAPPPAAQLRPPLQPPVRFVVDTHLGTLATYLRLLGFDTLYRNDFHDEDLARISSDEGRVLLTRDRGLLKRKVVVYGHCVRATAPRRQLLAVLHRYKLSEAVRPWRRCLRCNGRLAPVEKAAILDRLEPKTRLYYEEFQQCQSCGQVYWQGSHHARMESFIDYALEQVRK